jgi:hypothetical protein
MAFYDFDNVALWWQNLIDQEGRMVEEGKRGKK